MLQNSVIDSSYSMMLKRPWLRDAKIAHDWGNNTMTNQRNGTIRTIMVTYKHLGVGEKTISVVMLRLLKWYHR